jgi:hypothetical protein
MVLGVVVSWELGITHMESEKKYHEDMECSQNEDTPKSSKSLDHIRPYTERHPLVGPLAIFGFTRVPGF